VDTAGVSGATIYNGRPNKASTAPGMTSYGSTILPFSFKVPDSCVVAGP